MLILVVFVMAILSLYWAVLFKAEENMKNLKVAIVDFDGRTAPYNDVDAFVGPTLTKLVQGLVDDTAQPSLGYQVIPASEYGHDPMQVRQAVYDFHFWAAIVIHNNASSLLQSAFPTGNASYDPTGAVQTIFLSARDQNTIYEYVLPQFDQLEKQFMAQFGPVWARRIASNTSITADMLAAAPAAVNPAISFLPIDLRPFSPAAATPGVSIGLIYLIIIAFFSFAFFLPIHTVSETRGIQRILSMPRYPASLTLYGVVEIHHSSRSSPAALLSIHHLATVCLHHLVRLRLASLFARLARLPDPFLEGAGVAHRSGRECDGVRAGLVRGVLDAQHDRDDGAGHREREHVHDTGPALDGALAHLLGHYQRVDGVLQPRPRPPVLPLGLRLAAAQHCRGLASDPLRPTPAHRHQLRRALRLGRHQSHPVSALLLLHALENGAPEAQCRAQ